MRKKLAGAFVILFAAALIFNSAYVPQPQPSPILTELKALLAPYGWDVFDMWIIEPTEVLGGQLYIFYKPNPDPSWAQDTVDSQWVRAFKAAAKWASHYRLLHPDGMALFVVIDVQEIEVWTTTLQKTKGLFVGSAIYLGELALDYFITHDYEFSEPIDVMMFGYLMGYWGMGGFTTYGQPWHPSDVGLYTHLLPPKEDWSRFSHLR